MRPTARRFAAHPRDRPGGEGLVARGCLGMRLELYNTINYSYLANSINPAVKERFSLISGRQNHPLSVRMTM